MKQGISGIQPPAELGTTVTANSFNNTTDGKSSANEDEYLYILVAVLLAMGMLCLNILCMFIFTRRLVFKHKREIKDEMTETATYNSFDSSRKHIIPPHESPGEEPIFDELDQPNLKGISSCQCSTRMHHVASTTLQKETHGNNKYMMKTPDSSVGIFTDDCESCVLAHETEPSSTTIHHDHTTSCKSPTSEQHMHRFVPSESVTKHITGQDTITVGGCTISFPPDAFDEPQTVTVTAEIDPQRWPSEGYVMTPTLHVSAKNLKKPLTVKLSTWCLELETSGSCCEKVYIMRRNDDSESWKVIKVKNFDGSGFIKFKCQEFSFLTCIYRSKRRRQLYKAGVKPIVYHLNEDIVVALLLNSEIYLTKFLQEMKNTMGERVLHKTFQTKTARIKDNFESHLQCESHGNIKINPPGPFAHSVKKILQHGEPSFTRCSFGGLGQNHPDSVKLSFLCIREGEKTPDQSQTFTHEFRNSDTGPAQRNLPESGVGGTNLSNATILANHFNTGGTSNTTNHDTDVRMTT